MNSELPTLIQGGLFALVCLIIGFLLADRSMESKLTKHLREIENEKHKQPRKSQTNDRNNTV